MIVSLAWLADFVALDMPHEELASRLMMAGLNHEGTEPVGDDLAIELEVTSNRPDCLGHIGVAREVSVLWQRPLEVPDPRPAEKGAPAGQLAQVAIECPELCRRYTARVIRGVRVAPSPEWLVKRLETIGIAAINNVVDVTNYVLMECGQPLHAFDFGKLGEGRIVVREARKGEKFLAIDHKTYELEPGTCVIADANRAVALGGVMGGADTEVSEATRDLLIESADFDPLSIRTTARKLNLHSPSSYRFERGVDPEGVEWASRRACEMILDLAGGELAEGLVDAGGPPPPREAVALRLAELPRILGISIDVDEVRRTLTDLGCVEKSADAERIEVVPPTWRRDLTREIDLVEEAGRIHGYEQIPEDVGVPMVAAARSDADRGLARVRHVMTAAGYNEAMTLSAVSEAWSDAFAPWSGAAPLRCVTPVLRGADLLRRSLVPSLLGARRTNESLANPRIELFETATVYLPSDGELPVEEPMLAITSGGDYLQVKGTIEAVLAELNPAAELSVADVSLPLLDPARSAELRLGESPTSNGLPGNGRLGVIGELTAAGRKQFDLRGPCTVAEVRLGALLSAADLVRRQQPLSPYPAVSRDLNLVVDEKVRWADMRDVVRASGGPLVEEIVYQDTYRDAERLGAGKKSLLLSICLRRTDGTLTREEADQVRDQIVAKAAATLGAELRA